MSGRPRDELEARVARLERLLNQVLVLVQDLHAGSGAESTPVREDMPPEISPAERASVEEELEAAALREVLQEKVPLVEAVQKDTAHKKPAGKTWGGRGLWADLGVLAPGGTFLGRLGIALLLLSVAFFFKYSIDQGWLTEWVRLAIGVMAGITLVALGFQGAGKGEPLGTVLAGGGIATFFITGFVGNQWFDLVSYPVAFGFLVAASGLGIFLALRSGLQALAMVGLVGALATPLILKSPTNEVAGLALYVSLIVASVAAIYMARAWRAVLLMAMITTWLVLSLAVSQAPRFSGNSAWVVQGAVAFCALVFWLVPLLRAALRAGNPGRWLRPETVYDPWNTHLDALSLLMPLVGIGLSAWLWELSRSNLGWAFFGTALLAHWVGFGISRTPDLEGSARTQRFVSVLLATVGLGLVLTGDVLYLALIAEAVALFMVGSRKSSLVLLGLGGAVELVVTFLFIYRLGAGGTLLEGDLSSVFDFAAVGGAAVIGSVLMSPVGRQWFFVGAYLGLMALFGRELGDHPSVLYLTFILAAVVTQVIASSRKAPLLSSLGHVPALVLLSLFLRRLDAGFSLWDGDTTAWIDLGALAGAAYVGTLLDLRQGRRLYLFAAYVGLLAWTARELYPFEQGQAFMSLAFGVEGTILLVAGLLSHQSLLQKTGMATLLLVVVKVLVVDLAAVEPIWRVLLLFLFAVLFLVLSKFVQGRMRVRGELRKES